MTYDRDQLERLISREIDGESTAADREQLELLIQHEPGVERLLEDYRRLDREVGDALRVAVGAEPLPVARHSRWGVWRRGGMLLAAAAGLAFMVWLRPAPAPGPQARDQQPVQPPTRNAGIQADWFTPAARSVDVAEPVPSVLERPGLQVEGVDREWILVPARQRNVIYVIEVDRTQNHVIQVHQDF